MKAIFLALFVAAVTAAPLPEDSGSDAVEMIVNGVPEGAALDVSDIVDIKLKEHADGAVIETDLLHPYTVVGIAEAAAASVSNEVSVVDNDIARVYPMPIVVPSPPSSGVDTPVELPHIPIPEPIVLPHVPIPEPVVLPSPAIPEVLVVPELLPVAAPQFNSDVYNDGLVQVQYNGPESAGMLSTLQSWFNVVINYFNPPGAAGPAAQSKRF